DPQRARGRPRSDPRHRLREHPVSLRPRDGSRPDRARRLPAGSSRAGELRSDVRGARRGAGAALRAAHRGRALMRRALAALAVALPLAAQAEFRSIGEAAAVLYDAPSAKAAKLYVAGRNLPVEVIVTDGAWVR